ncbi:MAG: hypothetical protein ACRCZ2_01145 [Fusobacteriaceae bacterium]
MGVGLQLATGKSFIKLEEDINQNFRKLDEFTDFISAEVNGLKDEKNVSEYDESITYKNGDIVYMLGHEPGYIFEIMDGMYADPTRYKDTRIDYIISDKMFYKYNGKNFDMILEEKDKADLNLYTVAHKPPTQNFETTWDSVYPYSEIGRWLINKDTGVKISKMDKIFGDRRENAGSAVANDWNGTNGDIAVFLPRTYVNYKHTSQGKRIRFYSYKNPTKKIALDSYLHPAFDMGSIGTGDLFVAATKGRVVANQLRSHEGALTVSQTKQWFWDASRVGRNTEWNLTTIASFQLIADLYLMEFGNKNSQEVLGQGRSNTTTASSAGTTKTLGDRSGRVSTDDANGNVSYRGIEDCFGNVWEFALGYLCTDAGYHYTNDVASMDTIAKMTRLPVKNLLTNTSGFVKEYAKIEGHETLNIPTALGATSTTYATDNFWAHDLGEENLLMVGGYWSFAASCGVGCLTSAIVGSAVDSRIGGRFLKLSK